MEFGVALSLVFFLVSVEAVTHIGEDGKERDGRSPADEGCHSVHSLTLGRLNMTFSTCLESK